MPRYSKKMRQISRTSFILYMAFGVMVVAASLLGFYLLISHMFGVSFQQSLLIMVPMILAMTSATTAGIWTSYEHYFPSIKVGKAVTHNGSGNRLGRTIWKGTMTTIIGVFAQIYSLILFEAGYVFIGSILLLLGLAAAVILTLNLKKVLDHLFGGINL